MIKKRYYKNSGLGLTWDRIEVCLVALFRTTNFNLFCVCIMKMTRYIYYCVVCHGILYERISHEEQQLMLIIRR